MGDAPFGIDMATLDAVADDIAVVVMAGLRALPGDRRRQHLPRPVHGRPGHGAGQRRLHGHAGHGHERAGHAERAGEDRRRHPGAVGDPDGRGLRALHPPPRAAAPGEGQGGDLRRRPRRARSSPPTPPRRCAPPRWAATRCSRAPASTASTPPIPRRIPSASATARLSYQEVLAQDLRVMDASAISLMRDNAHPDRGVLDPRAGQPDEGPVTARGSTRRSPTPDATICP